MLLAQAKAMALCHEMVPGGKIGPAPNISLVPPATPPTITIFIKILSEYLIIFSDKPDNGGTQGILSLFRRKLDHGTQF